VRQVCWLGAVTAPARNPRRRAGCLQLSTVHERDIVWTGVEPAPGSILPFDAEPPGPRGTPVVHCSKPIMIVQVEQLIIRRDLDPTEVAERATLNRGPQRAD